MLFRKYYPIYLDANARWLPYTLISTLEMIFSSSCAKQSIETNSPLKNNKFGSKMKRVP
jgi:hypothetical protein